jgi:hypothetical protein
MQYRVIEIPGPTAISERSARRGEYGKTHEYPFLIGDRRELEILREGEEFNDQSAEKIIASSLEIDAETWFEGCRERLIADGLPDDELIGEWTGDAHPKGEIQVYRDTSTGKAKQTVFLGLADFRFMWQLPAVTKFGNFNACPMPQEHCAVLRYWESAYGAQIASMSAAVIECVVERPPRTKEAAMTLALQQYYYCSDFVEQGIGTIAGLGSTLLNSTYWYFWWD